jgi:hypothetical protein
VYLSAPVVAGLCEASFFLWRFSCFCLCSASLFGVFSALSRFSPFASTGVPRKASLSNHVFLVGVSKTLAWRTFGRYFVFFISGSLLGLFVGEPGAAGTWIAVAPRPVRRATDHDDCRYLERCTVYTLYRSTRTTDGPVPLLFFR